ncbi:ribonuclease D [Luminiphilus syltensis NOR5-1B]|uniref:Ribonuclease D n=1 Tax=Luminiphilus syltensis NOR5-1B TaxID=565045 RepID=B8KYG5_9GAMM|nr:ribonuclease D [Luminiphilus syltensis]EED35401.1 ribonuclease D [Luminiphilus syltensis NOR5-1B]
MSWEWVDSDRGLAEVVAQVIDGDFVAIDTEFRRRDTFWPEVALVQIATADQVWLIDPLPLTDTGPLAELLQKSTLTKVLHSAGEDLEVFQAWLGVLPSPLFDTQKAAALLGYGFGLSYAKLVEAVCQVSLDKDETNSDWLVRPLTSAQCRYAAQDVTYLVDVYSRLLGDAGTQGRLEWILEEGEGVSVGGRGPLAKFRNAWKLQPEALAVLYGLLDWREQQARERDRPRNWILHDKVINEIVRALPERLDQLAGLEGMSEGVVRRQGKALLALIAAARRDASSKPPEPVAQPLSGTQKRMAKVLAQAIENRASELRLSPEILFPKRDAELLARELCGDSIEVPSHWQGWRDGAIVKPLRFISEAVKNQEGAK